MQTQERCFQRQYLYVYITLGETNSDKSIGRLSPRPGAGTGGDKHSTESSESKFIHEESYTKKKPQQWPFKEEPFPQTRGIFLPFFPRCILVDEINFTPRSFSEIRCILLNIYELDGLDMRFYCRLLIIKARKLHIVQMVCKNAACRCRRYTSESCSPSRALKGKISW